MAKEESMRLRLTAEMKARLQAAAERKGVTMTALVEQALGGLIGADEDEVAEWEAEVRNQEAEAERLKMSAEHVQMFLALARQELAKAKARRAATKPKRRGAG